MFIATTSEASFSLRANILSILGDIEFRRLEISLETGSSVSDTYIPKYDFPLAQKRNQIRFLLTLARGVFRSFFDPRGVAIDI